MIVINPIFASECCTSVMKKRGKKGKQERHLESKKSSG